VRIRELSLLAYGPFTGTTLDLSAPGLHVVYGRNEAGKSTALRATKGLLYGIDPRTGDAHVHAMRDLRIGAALEDEEGHVLRVVRRKGAANTLLDAAGKAMDEAPLRRMLGGTSVELFEKMFGLDHESLREGGEALALGHGDVGESLFGASLGREVHDVLASLRAEADALFAPAPNATRPPLNAALRGFAEAQKRVRALSDSQAILVQQQGLDEALAERVACEKEKRDLSAEASRVKRARDVVPLLARRAVVAARRRDIGDVPMLPESAPRDREEAERDRVEAALRAGRIEKDVEVLAASKAAVVVPSGIDREDVVEDVQHRLGAHRKARDEIARLRGELAGLEEEGRALSARMRVSSAGTPKDTADVDAAALTRVKKLAMQHAGIDERARRAERELSARRRETDDARAALATLPPAADAAPLRRAASRAQPHGDVDQRVRRADAEVAARTDAARALVAQLGLFGGTAEDARALAVPAAATVERFAQVAAQASLSAAKLSERRDEAAMRAARATRDVDALRRAADVPTEEALAAARGKRDVAWRAVRTELTEAAARRFEPTMTEADAIADRLRREADRVARLAALEAERAAAEAELARTAVEGDELSVARAKADAEWRALWASAGIAPLPPPEMRAWLERHEKVKAAAEALRAAELARAALSAEAEELRAMLHEAIGEGAGAHEDVAALLARVTEEERARTESAQARAAADRAVVAAERAAAEALHEHDDSAAALASWQGAWGSEVRALGLPEGALPEEATSLADDLAAQARAVEEARRVGRRLSALEREAAAFAADVESLAARHAPDLCGRPTEEVAGALVKRHAASRDAASEVRRLDALLAEKRAALAEQLERRALAEARLDSMKRTARAEDLESLERAERVSAEARTLDGELLALDARLAELGHAAAAAPPVDLDEAALEARADEIAQRLDELDQRHRLLERNIGGLEKGLADIRKESAAAQAAAEAQEHLARVRALAERWARVHVAEVLLAREIDRYRERHQGPVLARAGMLFTRMTLGAFTGLRVAYGDDDQPVLECVRAAASGGGGAAFARVAALSDGTRDQLYLSLRLATLERYAETCAPLPLVVDDILVHFDDERARASLAVLGEVSARMQVLLFTHHARVVDIAKEAARATVHTLGAGAPAAVTSPSC
jgi:uncharacterized protein YhaN